MRAPECHCPFCKKQIDPFKLIWKCPVCDFSNKSSILDGVCEYCYFSPRLIPCPYCGEFYEMWLLMGDYEGSYARIFHPSKYPIRTKVNQRVCDLDFAVTGNLIEEDLTLLGEDVLREFALLEFELPYKVAKLMVHTVHKSDDDIIWLHCWLYKDPASGPPAESQAQLSVRCNIARATPEIKVWITDVQMAQ